MLNAEKLKENLEISTYKILYLGEYGEWNWEAFGYAMAVLFGGLALIFIVNGCRNWKVKCLKNMSVWNYFKYLLTKLKCQ